MGAVPSTSNLPFRKVLKFIFLCPEEESDLDQEGWVCTAPCRICALL